KKTQRTMRSCKSAPHGKVKLILMPGEKAEHLKKPMQQKRNKSKNKKIVLFLAPSFPCSKSVSNTNQPNKKHENKAAIPFLDGCFVSLLIRKRSGNDRHSSKATRHHDHFFFLWTLIHPFILLLT